jgi:hypothetical protein
MKDIKIKLAENVDNEYSYICLANGSKDFRCHICGKDDTVLLCTDNSDGDNNSVSMCKECCLKIFESKFM